ncbi:MAG: hypothetical protein HY931_00730 [Candidatus Falkowbacteria bacterium]|nr:MAG: hypothetical protein HY931_00730 [Candidatus Falkowbacteria bacterium]
MSNPKNISIKGLKKQILKERKFLDDLLLNNNLKEIDRNWKKYIVSIFFIDILKITEDLVVLLESGSGYVDSVATRLLVERYIYFKYILKGKNQGRFNNWILKNYRKEKSMIGKILGNINNHKIEEEKKFINKTELSKHIKFLNEEISKVSKQTTKSEEFDFSDMITELDVNRKDKLNHYLYYVVYPLLSSDVHGSARSMESHFKKEEQNVILNEKKDKPELLTTALYINKEIFKVVKKTF